MAASRRPVDPRAALTRGCHGNGGACRRAWRFPCDRGQTGQFCIDFKGLRHAPMAAPIGGSGINPIRHGWIALLTLRGCALGEP
jgi:hypothetical protein